MKRRPRTNWTPELLAQLNDLYPYHKTQVVAERMGLTIHAVYNKAFDLDLKKSDEFLASVASGRVQRGKQNPNTVKHQFKPGLVPWNKGKDWHAGGRSIQTQFKPHSKPHNTLALGSYRVVNCKGKAYLEQKTSEGPGNNSARWTSVMRLVWKKHHGEIPPGHIVIFKDPAQHTAVLEEITIDKLEMVDRGEHARRNHPRNKSPELGRLVQLKGAITRQVNRLVSEHKQQQESRP
jgi:hypothetical protein